MNADGVTINVNIDGAVLSRVIEEEFAKRTRRRMAYAEAADAFAMLERDQQTDRAETAATLLACIGGE